MGKEATKKEQEEGLSERISSKKEKDNIGKRRVGKCSMKNGPVGSAGVIRKQKAWKAGPSKDEIRKMVSEIVKEDDFGTSRPDNVLKQLDSFFGINLTHMKEAINLMIKEELLKIVGLEELSEDDNEEENGQPAGGHNSENTVNLEKFTIKEIPSSTSDTLPGSSVHSRNKEERVKVNQGGSSSTPDAVDSVEPPGLEELDLAPAARKQKDVMLTLYLSDVKHIIFYADWDDKVFLVDRHGAVIVAFVPLDRPPLGCASSGICVGYTTNEKDDTALVFLEVYNVCQSELLELADAGAAIIFRRNAYRKEKGLETAGRQEKVQNPGLVILHNEVSTLKGRWHGKLIWCGGGLIQCTTFNEPCTGEHSESHPYMLA